MYVKIVVIFNDGYSEVLREKENLLDAIAVAGGFAKAYGAEPKFTYIKSEDGKRTILCYDVPHMKNNSEVDYIIRFIMVDNE